MSEIRQKKHADFQDSYRRNSNFGSSKKNFTIDKDGRLKLKKGGQNFSKDIQKSVDNLLN